jgi:hypothetical protein
MSYLFARGDAGRLPLGDMAVDATIGSPPYVDARLYLEAGVNLGIARGLEEWVGWMLAVTAECLRVSRGPVIWVAAGKTEDRNYWPACEMLMTDWFRRGGSMYRPCYWHRYGIPGSGGDDWFRFDVEHCMCFKRPGRLAWADNTACGRKPQERPGGRISHCMPDGTRISAAKDRAGGKNADGSTKYAEGWALKRGYVNPDLSNPGTLFSTGAGGGGNIGHPLAHHNEAPYPTAVPEFFIRSVVPPGGVVLDPFSGSGTTAEAAAKHGRRAIGLDLRMSQCRLASRRLERPHAPVPRRTVPEEPGGLLLFDRPAAGGRRAEGEG